MRRYQLSGLEHVHMMRHVPRSYDMTRTHILHRSVNHHVDVVLRCAPKNWKKKKVTVTVVKGEKKNEAANIIAHARKGYVAVRKKPVNEQFEADRKKAAAAYSHEIKYGAKNPGSDSLIRDMKSQISAMAKKSADYIEDQLAAKQVQPVAPNTEPPAPTAEEKRPDAENAILSAETEEILKKGGYRLPYKQTGNPYAANYSMHTSNEEFHYLMDSLEKSLDEACRKYAVEPVVSDTKEESGSENKTEVKTETADSKPSYSEYYGGYNAPDNISLSVTHKQEVTSESKPEPQPEPEESQEKNVEGFRPSLVFTDGGELDTREDDLFERELDKPHEGYGYVPPAYFFDDDQPAPVEADGEEYVPLPDPDGIPVRTEPQKQEIFRIVPDEQSEAQENAAYDDYPHEDYVQQQVFLQSDKGVHPVEPLYNPPQEEEDFAEPTLYSDQNHPEEESGYDPPMVFPDRDDDPPPTIFPDEDDEDAPPPMIFPDEGEDEGYSPAPVSPDRNEYFDDGDGVVHRSDQTLFSRTDDRVKKVIGVIKGEPRLRKQDGMMRNRNVDITYSDRRHRSK